ncbi:MAG TPA: carboxymuconolactone decarboxylase family protein [Solirubrobacteraceae bacterium]|nr:carboxymuconolactone decarboxylase family protein [Solirubrobacteraceae bacterium]
MRLPILTPEDMTPRQQELSDRISGKRGGTRGPFLCWLHSPELCDKVEALGAFVRFESSLDLSLRELILLISARNFDAQYSWNAHIDRCVEAGVGREALEQIARKERPDFGDERDQDVVYRFCTELLTEHFVSDETFAEAHELFGSQGCVDIIGTLGNYSMLALCLNAFQVDLQPDREPPYPDIRGYARVAPVGSA